MNSKPFKLTSAAIKTLITLVVIFIIGLWFIGNYNSLVTSKNQVDKSWAKVETQYQRRFDLIGNLVESVKADQKQELAVFSAIAEARKQYNSASTINNKTQAIGNIETNLALVPKLQEAYPDLKSNLLMKSLMTELSGTENEIATVRNTFNDTATNYNNNITRFPKNLFAKTFGFTKTDLFKSVTEASKAVQVKF